MFAALMALVFAGFVDYYDVDDADVDDAEWRLLGGTSVGGSNNPVFPYILFGLWLWW